LVAELQRAGGRGDHAVVGVLGRLDVGAGADAERLPEVVDQPVQRRSLHFGHVLHARSVADGCEVPTPEVLDH
jgi:hypothetical protein